MDIGIGDSSKPTPMTQEHRHDNHSQFNATGKCELFELFPAFFASHHLLLVVQGFGQVFAVGADFLDALSAQSLKNFVSWLFLF